MSISNPHPNPGMSPSGEDGKPDQRAGMAKRAPPPKLPVLSAFRACSHSSNRAMNAGLGRTTSRRVRTNYNASSRDQPCCHIRYATVTMPPRLTPA